MQFSLRPECWALGDQKTADAECHANTKGSTRWAGENKTQRSWRESANRKATQRKKKRTKRRREILLPVKIALPYTLGDWQKWSDRCGDPHISSLFIRESVFPSSDSISLVISKNSTWTERGKGKLVYLDDAILMGTLSWLLIIIMSSSERPSKGDRITKTVRSFKGKVSSLFNLSRPRIPLSVNVDPTDDNYIATTDAGTRWVTESCRQTCIDWDPCLQVICRLKLPLDHTPMAVISTERQGTSPISVPVSASIPTAPRELGSVGSPGTENPLTVSNRIPLTIVVAKCYSFSQLRTPKCRSSKAFTMYKYQNQRLLWPTLSVQQCKRQYSC